MKRVTVRELRTQFPKIEAMLLNGEELAITKRGQVVAWLVQPISREPKRKLDFKRRFGGPIKRLGPRTDVLDTLLKEREEAV
jgi:antitoxin (DNA-binding transcriptional repressor) of toxin-antitoxin stability system